MKDLTHIKRFNESEENLNISDVSGRYSLDEAKKLEDCKIGDLVRIWCIGTLCWDDEVVKIVEKGILITVQYMNVN
jgi:hypothetical protein